MFTEGISFYFYRRNPKFTKYTCSMNVNERMAFGFNDTIRPAREGQRALTLY